MTFMILHRNYPLIFVLLVPLAASLLLPINASAGTNTYTTGMSVTTQSILNANYNASNSYNAVVLLATNPAQYHADLYVDSAVNMRLGGSGRFGHIGQAVICKNSSFKASFVQPRVPFSPEGRS